MSGEGKRLFPVRIVSREWKGGRRCPEMIGVQMNDGRIRKYGLIEEEPKFTVEKVDRVPEIRRRLEKSLGGSRFIESFTILKLLEKNSYGGYKDKTRQNK